MNDEKISSETSGDEKILGKFDNVEALAKSYKELESKLGTLTADKKKEEESSRDAKLDEVVKANAELKAKIDAIEKAKADNAAEANKALKEKDFRNQVAQGIAKLPEDKVAEINKRIEEGKVSEAEMQFIASLAEAPAESSEKIAEDEAAPVPGAEDALSEYKHLLANKAAIYCNPRHPQHKEVSDRRLQLEKKLGIR